MEDKTLQTSPNERGCATQDQGMPLTSTITEYDSQWPQRFEREAARLRPIFGQFCMALHHIGSTAVEGLCAKPEIDVLCVVKDTTSFAVWVDGLAQAGYVRGGDLMEGHHFFKRDVRQARTHKLDLCQTGHPQIDRMLKIRDHLRTNAKDRKAFAALKRQLERENTSGIAEYLKGKAPFLDDLYRKLNERL